MAPRFKPQGYFAVIRLCASRAVFAFFGLLALGALLGISQPRLREWWYREASYEVVLNWAVGQETDPRLIAERIIHYVQRKLFQGESLPDEGDVVIDTDSWTHLVRGLGWCDQKAWTIGTLLALRGIDSRLVMLRLEDNTSPHTVLEVRLDGKWVFVDPTGGWLMRDPTGRLLTLEEVSQHPSVLEYQPAFQLLGAQAKAVWRQNYAKLFPMQNTPMRWRSMLENRRRSRLKALAGRMVRGLGTSLGDGWRHRFQDVYLTLAPEKPPTFEQEYAAGGNVGMTQQQTAEALRLYYKARNYQLYRRWAAAAAVYRKILAEYPASSWARKSQMWFAVVELRQEQPAEAVDTLRTFLRRWPDSAWESRIYGWMAWALMLQGNMQDAHRFIALSLADPCTPTANWMLTEQGRQLLTRTSL